MSTVKEFLDYKNITFGMQIIKNIQIFLGWILLLLQKKNLHATVEVNLLYSLLNELVICSAFRSIFLYLFYLCEKTCKLITKLNS